MADGAADGNERDAVGFRLVTTSLGGLLAAANGANCIMLFFPFGNSRARNLRPALLLASIVAITVLALPEGAGAHNGPPFPIIVDQQVGPCVISVWADPNVGTGSFYVMVNPASGRSIPSDLTVQVGVQPVSGRLPEAVYPAERNDQGKQVQYKAVMPFDQQEFWKIRIRLESSQGSAETATSVEVTPVGLGRWDMLFYLSPFLAVGLLWLVAVVRKRSRRKHNFKQKTIDQAGVTNFETKV